MRGASTHQPSAIVAIPAHDEEDRIGDCLAALAMQRGPDGAPLEPGRFTVLVLANNCRDATAAVARAFAEVAPFPLHVVECRLPPAQAHAGGARRAAMDRAADLLEAEDALSGIILTTDADSRAASTWISATLSSFGPGIAAVAGYIDADASEYLALGAGFLNRGRLEDRYLSRVAELYARLDPRRHDPWPNHRVHSGAAIAVTLAAYRAIGGLPVRPLGEDSALAEAIEDGGLLIRHSLEPVVTTSCRFDSRAPGGAGDTMRARHQDLDAPCDGDLETAARLFRRARLRGSLRKRHAAGRLAEDPSWRIRLGLGRDEAATLATATIPFSALWRCLEASSPVLRTGPALRPSDLPREIDSIERLLRRLDRLSPPRSADPIDIQALAEPRPDAIAVPPLR